MQSEYRFTEDTQQIHARAGAAANQERNGRPQRSQRRIACSGRN
jgi:hypothetical protein